MPRKKRPPEASAPHPIPILPAVNPAVEGHGDPAYSVQFPIVAVGASAGGVEALSALFAEIPADSGVALVVVLHMPHARESLLPAILARVTRAPVVQVTERTPVQVNHVYVMAPGDQVVFAHGELRPEPVLKDHLLMRPIDHLMRSLAESHGHKAIGVVLSGSGNDGMLGMQEIKGAGGLTFVQDDSAQHSSMPHSVISTGSADVVLSAAGIGQELARIAQHPYVGDSPDPRRLALTLEEESQVLQAIRQQAGVDFANYKRSTLHRRITRRLVLLKLDSVQDYVARLAADPSEVQALYQDILINVTSFFRNPESYEALKRRVFPLLTEDRGRHDPLRVWALGCSTGEEAYSLAMTFMEYAEESGRHVGMQIFATDLNAVGVERARSGVYGKGIAQDVSAERLRRFFVEVDGSYRVAKPIRDMCVFARHNVLSDPPFSRLDLVACRNLLIYLDPVLQQKLIPLLHYALRGHGFLWLGNSETIGSYRNLFELVEQQHKIYVKKQAPHAFPGMPRRLPRESAPGKPAPAIPELLAHEDPQKQADRMLLSRYAPPCVVVNSDLEILQFRGDTGPYLSPTPGKATLSLLRMLREGLAVAVRGAINRAKREGTAILEEGLRVRVDGAARQVDVGVVPLRAGSPEGAFLVVFEEPAKNVQARARQLEAEAAAQLGRASPGEDPAEEVARLRHELSATREYLQSVIEQQEVANEELQSANEEVQSANEELQSINEELETSKEEIQSANEELATVNDELQNRNTELFQTNNDLVNLVASVQMAILMVGPDLRIRRFSPAAEKLFKLSVTDIGRPIRQIKGGPVAVDDIDAMVLEVMESVTLREQEVRDGDGRWYSLRVRPYRTLENRIDGAVIVLVDIDTLKRAEHAVRESEARFEMLADSAPVPIWLSDSEGLMFVNRAFEQFVGAAEVQVRQTEPGGFVHPDDRETYRQSLADAIRNRKSFEARLRWHRADGEYRWMKTVVLPRFLPDGTLMGHVGCTFDITDMAEAEQALMELDRGKNEFLAMLAHELRNPLAGVRNACRLLADTREEAIIAQAREIIDRQTSHMTRMVDDLLDVSRITHGKIQIRPEPVDLNGVLRRTIDTTAPERELGQQALAASIPEEALWVRGDAMRLDQVFSNLLNNASKFTRRGGRVWVTAEREAGRMPVGVVRVRDNGIGIEAAVLPRVFDLFVQADRADTTRTGIGLGLTLARRLVELHGGTIEARSAGVGHGSEFIVRIPLLPAAEIPKGDTSAVAVPCKASPSRRILVVDDNRDSAESLRLMLRVMGHEVRLAYEGGAVVAEAAAFKPDAILLDIGLPDIDGYEVARRLRADAATREVLVIAVTGYGREEDVRRTHQAGMDEHVTKPIDPDVVMALVERGRTRRHA